MKIKSILVTQPRPESEKSPYIGLSKKHKLKIDFIPFFHIQGVSARAFRHEKINILDYTGVIMTSRHCIDHYFRLCNELRAEVPEDMKYFCTTESTAYYIQKYILYRKRKVFHGAHNIHDLMPALLKHKDEKFLLPCSNVHNKEIDKALDSAGIIYKKALFYRTVPSDLSRLKIPDYNVLVFFSPADVKSLVKNFPKFRQNNTQIAAFGSATAKAVKNAGFQLNIHAPTPDAPSMTMALENFILNGKNGKK